MTEDKKKILVIGGTDHRSIALRLGGALDLGPAVVVATRNEEPRERSLQQKIEEFGLPGGLSAPNVGAGLTLEPLEWKPTAEALARKTPPESRLRRARAAVALASMLTGCADPGVFVREDLRAGRCTHKFGLAGGFSSCAVCGVKTKKERKT